MTPLTKTIAEVLREAVARLSPCSPSPLLDAQLLFAHTLGCERIWIVAHADDVLSEADAHRFWTMIERRVQHEPIAYITGTKEFWGLPMYVSPAVLVPRPETELIVELAVRRAKELSSPVIIADLGTGTGCIAIAIAHELHKAKVAFHIIGVEKSVAALQIAERNLKHHEFERTIPPGALELRAGSWFEPITGERFDIIVSNPPYIARNETDLSPDLIHEPESALYAEAQGLAEIEAIIKDIHAHLTSGGSFFCEIGATQAHTVSEILRASLPNAPLSVHRDLSGRDRVVELHLQ